MALPWMPRFEYDTGPTTLDFSIPARPYMPVDSTIGGTDRSAAGIPAAYEIRRDHNIVVSLRFYESEWPSVQAMLEFGQAHPNTMTFYPDQTVTGTSFTVYLEVPKMGERIAPRRMPDFTEVYELDIELSQVNSGSSTPDIQWFAT